MFRCFPAKLIAVAILMGGIFWWHSANAKSELYKTYVGSEACRKCHDAEYDRFKAYAKKADSYKHIMALRKGLTEAEFRQCLECHTTGYGKPGGFRSELETPGLKDAGCEVCHGPGSTHVESQDPKDVKGKLVPRDCETCHNADRVAAFRFKPLVFGGAH